MEQLSLDLKEHVYSVSELTFRIRMMLETELSEVWVEGEISGFKHHSSGHMYFTLKDEKSVLPAAMFKPLNMSLKFTPEEGMKVIARGRVTIYDKRGNYQIIVEGLEPAGKGALYLAFEQLKAKLEKEGLFDPAHKKPIPAFPEKIGIITSPTGAAIRDMLRTITERFPVSLIVLRPVQVQGDSAAREVAGAIRELNDMDEAVRPDVLIAGRGGGSIEDLWAFNEEIVARAIFDSNIPVISAVGHETDFTISDFVADVRALTPTDAGKRVIQKSKRELLNEIREGWAARLYGTARQVMKNSSNSLSGLSSLLRTLHPRNRIDYYKQQLDSLSSEMSTLITHFTQIQGEGIKNLKGRLAALNPESILKRGYSITFLVPEMKVVREAIQVNENDEIETRVMKGKFRSKIIKDSKLK